MFAFPRRSLSAIVLLLQLVLGTRGLMNVGDLAMNGERASSHPSATASGSTESSLSGHEHHHASSDDAAVTPEQAPAGEHEEHGAAGCHSSSPCCAPTVPLSDEREIRAAIVRHNAPIRSTDDESASPARGLRRQPPSTAPPSRF